MFTRVEQNSEVHILCEIDLEERDDLLEANGFDPDKVKNITLVHHLGQFLLAAAAAAAADCRFVTTG